MLQSVRTEGANMNIDEAVEEVEILGSYYGNDFNGEPTKEKRAIETVLQELSDAQAEVEAYREALGHYANIKHSNADSCSTWSKSRYGCHCYDIAEAAIQRERAEPSEPARTDHGTMP
jgi:hypothetical protein